MHATEAPEPHCLTQRTNFHAENSQAEHAQERANYDAEKFKAEHAQERANYDAEQASRARPGAREDY
jgi:hypothetical protein